jgi:dolichol-phosphate mannosyltransferase
MANGPQAAVSNLTHARRRATRALRRPHNWVQLAKFSTVGATGYAVNLAVYAALVEAGLHYNLAALCSFLVAVTNNYTWNRVWTFRGQRGHIGYQGVRFLIVSLIALAANEILLTSFVAFGVGKIVAQAVAVVLVMPINFVGNKLWSFRGPGPRGLDSPKMLRTFGD